MDAGGRATQDAKAKNTVDFPDGMEYVPGYELEIVAKKNTNHEEMIEQCLFGRVSDIRRNLTHALLSGRLSNMIYSLDATKTDFYPHQFKPVLAFLESPSRGLLIADEVGLGKTIEAGSYLDRIAGTI